MDPTPSAPPISLRPAPVLAGVGTFLLTAAAVSFVSARWDRFGPGDRFGALLVASALVFGLALALRRIAPATARSLDVLMAALVPVDVAALAMVSGASWPTVLLAAGPAAMGSAEVLRRRDPIAVTEIGTVIGGLLAMAGVAARVDVSLTVLVAALGLIGCVVSPWGRERAAGPVWAGLAGLAPALRVFDELAFTGDGTMRRLGLLDATPWEATLAAGIVATGALIVTVITRRSLFAAVTGAAVVVATGAALWAEHQPPRSLLVVAAAILVALAEIGLTHPMAARLPRARSTAESSVAAVNAVLTFVIAGLASEVLLPETSLVGPEWAYAAAISAFAWIVADVRRMARDGRSAAQGGGWAPATWGAVAGALSAVAITSSPVVTGVAALSIGVALFATARAGRLSVAWTAGVAGSVLLVDGDWRVAVLGAGVGTVLIALAAVGGRRGYDETLGAQAIAGVFVPIGVAAVVIWPHSTTGSGAAVLLLAWVAATIVDVAVPSAALALRGLGAAVLIGLAGDDSVMAALALLTSSLLLLAHLSATRQRSSAILGGWAALVGIALLVAAVLEEPTVLLAMALATIGLTVVGWGFDNGVEAARVGGGFIVWWASLVGLVGADVASLEPYLYPILALIGWALHADGSPESRWTAVGIPLGLAALVAFGQRIDSGNAGHTLLLGAIALALCVAGALRRHQPALVAGAATTVAVGAFEALDQVVGIESWSWLVVSGACAITIAATLELSENDESLVGGG